MRILQIGGVSHAEQTAKWNYSVKITIGFDDWRKIAIIHKRRSNRNAIAPWKKRHLLLHLLYYLAPNLALALDFDKIHSATCLEKQIDLQSATRTIPRSCAAVWCHRSYGCLANAKQWTKHGTVVHDKILKRQPFDGIPAVKLVQSPQFVLPFVYDALLGLNVLEIKPAVVVLQAIALLPKILPCFGVLSLVACDKTGLLQLLERLPDIADAIDSELFGNLRRAHGAIDKQTNYPCAHRRLSCYSVMKHFVEICPQD